MTQEQIAKIIQEIRTLNKLSNDNDTIIEIYVNRAVDRAKAFCNRDDIPVTLNSVISQIACDMLIADKVIQVEDKVSSITRGDTSISYRDGSLVGKDTLAFMKNYESSLIPFKKMKLPKDEPYARS